MNQSILVAEEITFAYPGDDPIFSEWSYEFRSGEMVGLTGPSGRGKSTLLYLLGLMLKPDQGDISVLGHSTKESSDAERANLRANVFGFVFQDAALDATRTVLDNVVEGALYRGEPRAAAIPRAQVLLEHFGVALRSDHKPGQISGGQAQRIALCRGLLNDPRVLIADEPTGNLDDQSSTVVIEALLAQAQRGATVIVATHDPRMIESCDRVACL